MFALGTRAALRRHAEHLLPSIPPADEPDLRPRRAIRCRTLVAIRIAAMRDRLERIGRFDPQRARDRLLASFAPAFCRFIEAGKACVRFDVVRPAADRWRRDHRSIAPEQQGKGIGAAVLRERFAEAGEHWMPVRVGALRDGDSNRFSERHGFVRADEAEWDIDYRREPRTAMTQRPRAVRGLKPGRKWKSSEELAFPPIWKTRRRPMLQRGCE